MARLASQEKLGFYPTPPVVVQAIKRMLNPSPKARIIDTCCGEGDALWQIAQGTDCITYGVELDKPRYLKAKQKLHHVLWCDALHEFICTRDAFSLLFLNPPYDTTDVSEEEKAERVEMQFLRKHFSLLQNGGVLVFVIPFRVATQAIRFLHTKCRELYIFRFPEDEYWVFKQVVIIAVKGKPNGKQIAESTALLSRLTDLTSYTAFEVLDDITEAELEIELPAPSGGEIMFKSVRLDPDEAALKVKNSPLWKQVKAELFRKKSLSSVHPLMPLREGHLAMLLASGLMNGEVHGRDGRLIIKGSVKKEKVKTDEYEGDSVKTIIRDKYKIQVRAIRFEPEPEIVTIA